jgi:hypothetical protein
MEKEELELLEGFRRLCPVDRNTIMTAVTIAVSAEQAVKRQYNLDTKEPSAGKRTA